MISHYVEPKIYKLACFSLNIISYLVCSPTWLNLFVTLNAIFGYIMKLTPKNTDLGFPLQPFFFFFLAICIIARKAILKIKSLAKIKFFLKILNSQDSTKIQENLPDFNTWFQVCTQKYKKDVLFSNLISYLASSQIFMLIIATFGYVH